jgi:RNA polymerase sigma factor (sigma-70 family)
MLSPDAQSDDRAHDRPEFTTTHWSVVREAGQPGSPGATGALERLCQCYWYPLYAFVRRKGHSAHDAQDLTQEFFARFLERKYVALADQSRGKFRNFLIKSIEHFLINEWNKGRAAKRASLGQIISWDEQEAEKRYLLEPSGNATPEAIFEKRWAMSLLESALARLGEEFSAPGKRELFAALKFSVWGEQVESSYQEIAAKFGMGEGAVKGAVHRLRHRYRELLRAEVAETVATAAEVDEELRHLAVVLRSGG